jgi:hypothetical protein
MWSKGTLCKPLHLGQKGKSFKFVAPKQSRLDSSAQNNLNGGIAGSYRPVIIPPNWDAMSEFIALLLCIIDFILVPYEWCGHQYDFVAANNS